MMENLLVITTGADIYKEGVLNYSSSSFKEIYKNAKVSRKYKKKKFNK